MTSKVYRNTLQKNEVQLSNTAEPVKKPEISDWAYTIDDIQLEEADDKVFAEIDALVEDYDKLPEEERKPHIPGCMGCGSQRPLMGDRLISRDQ